MTYEPVTLDHLLEHQSWALRLARQLVREDQEAEELVQRTWIAALRRPPSSGRGARAWIRQVILNLARERHRRAGTRTRHELASRDPERTAPDVAEDLSREEIRSQLAARLLALQEPYRTVLTLRYYEDLSSNEIGERLGVPAGTVRWRMKVGLDQLREELDRESHGDRQRWVSALMLLLPRSGAEAPLESAPLATGTFPWVGLALGLTCLLGAGWMFWPEAERTQAEAAARLVAAAEAEDTPATAQARPGAPERETLAPAPEPAANATRAEAGLAVHVRDARGLAVEGARLIVLGRGTSDERARTGADGNARVPLRVSDAGALGVAATRERVALLVLAEGHAAALWHVDPTRARSAALELALEQPASPLSGRVVDARGEPVADAELGWYEPTAALHGLGEGDFTGPVALTTRSAPDGSFTLAHVGAPGGTILAQAAGFAPLSFVVENLAAPLELVLQPGAVVEGRVLLADGRPAPDVLVGTEPVYKASEWAATVPGYDPTRRGFPEQTRTDAEGRFRLARLTPGTRTLWAGDERGSASATLELAEGDTQAWNPTLGEGHALRLRLLDPEGNPLAGWLVVLRRPGPGGTWWIRRLVSAADGRVETHECPAEDVYLDVFPSSGLGPSHASRRVRASPDELELEVDTHALGTVRGQCLDANGTPTRAGTLQLVSLRTAIKAEPLLEPDGRFELRLPPGTYATVLRQAQGAAYLGSFVLEAGQEHDLGSLQFSAPGTLRITPGALANGTVRTPSYTLYAQFEAQRSLECGQGELGDEVLLTLLPGTYRVLLFDGAGASASTHWVTIRSFEEARLTP